MLVGVRAVVVSEFGARPAVVDVPVPRAAPGGVVLAVEATGLCRSDWHGWQGHDPDLAVPYVPGHELAGTVHEVGAGVTGWAAGDRVTVPFVCACGSCEQCLAGQHQVCLAQQQPGFTYDGSFAEYVAVPGAAVNLVAVPDALDLTAAAALGCRFATAYRAVTQVGQVRPGEWLVVFGCGGVGLSAVMVGAAAGARVVGVDPNPDALALASAHGAAHVLADPAGLVQLTGGGAHVSVDAVGSVAAVRAALGALRPGGRHVQVGLLPGEITLDVSVLVGRELRWLGSHGMAAHAYPGLLGLVAAGTLHPERLVTREIGLAAVPDALAELGAGLAPAGITVIRPRR
jgi:D-arabinose 1-dehydrogenase-like Zn-dependent alcohol dehydrogenase